MVIVRTMALVYVEWELHDGHVRFTTTLNAQVGTDSESDLQVDVVQVEFQVQRLLILSDLAQPGPERTR